MRSGPFYGVFLGIRLWPPRLNEKTRGKMERKGREAKKKLISRPYLLLYELQLTRKTACYASYDAVNSGAGFKRPSGFHSRRIRSRSRSRKRSHNSDVIGVRRIRSFPFLPISLTTPSLTFRLWSSENRIVGVGSRNGRINQSQCSFPRFVIGFSSSASASDSDNLVFTRS